MFGLIRIRTMQQRRPNAITADNVEAVLSFVLGSDSEWPDQF